MKCPNADFHDPGLITCDAMWDCECPNSVTDIGYQHPKSLQKCPNCGYEESDGMPDSHCNELLDNGLCPLKRSTPHEDGVTIEGTEEHCESCNLRHDVGATGNWCNMFPVFEKDCLYHIHITE